MAEKAAATKTALAPTSGKTGALLEKFEKFDEIYDSIARRAFEIFAGNGWWGHDLENWFKAEAELLHPMHVNLGEKDGTLTLQAEVPGFTAKDLEIRLEPRSLTISGKRETSEETKKGGKIVSQEYCSDQILRVIPLPAEVDPQKVTATLKDGILKMQMPKGAQPADTRVRIEVKAA